MNGYNCVRGDFNTREQSVEGGETLACLRPLFSHVCYIQVLTTSFVSGYSLPFSVVCCRLLSLRACLHAHMSYLQPVFSTELLYVPH